MGLPYIEYQDKNGETIRLEFKANTALKAQYDKDKQKRAMQAFENSEDDFDKEKINKIDSEIKTLREKIESGEINEKTIEENKSMQKTMAKYYQMVATFDSVDIDYEYCYKMAHANYDISRSEWEEILEGMEEDYGRDFVTEVITSICEKVFTQVGVKKPKKARPVYDFMKN